MTSKRVSGPFDVKLTQLEPDAEAGAPAIGRRSIEKQFHGELEGTSRGQMLSMSRFEVGSGGYVAMERVSGTLQGRRGTFALQHSGTMMRGAPQLSVTVVPESGTDELVGLEGRMEIIIEDGKHSYVFDYTLPEPR